MKIIHSSDLHLNKNCPERAEALDRILEAGQKQKAEAVLIAGDFFDSKADSDYFRPVLRQKFNDIGFKVYLIPGNHDYGSFEGDLFFGNQLQVLNKKPFEVIDFNQLRVVAVPYFNQDFNRYAMEIGEAKAKDRPNALLLHCSLDAPFISGDEFGEEQGEGYLPVSSRVLAELGFNYVLAGHYHSRFMVHDISDTCTFVYPGSPVSVTRKEKGPRAVALLDTEKRQGIGSLSIKSSYYDRLTFSLEPQKEKEVLDRMAGELSSHDPSYALLEVILEGFTSMGERTLKEKIDNTLAGFKNYNLNLSHNYRDIAEVLSDPLYIKFRDKLKERDLDEALRKEIDNSCRLFLSRLKYER
ncbi:MAG: metallophosphoesterase family protein [Actinomycetota bacterium]